MSHGLVIGKFYPPHAGHHLLVRAAAAACARVTVIAMAATRESIPLAQRVDWLREAHALESNVTVTGIMDDVPIDYADPAIWTQHVALMRLALARIAAPPVTAVFTSEPYGAELARRFDAIAVAVDPGRRLAPVSSTLVRSDPAAHWEYLSAPVREALALRVVVLGAESSGTTTLSRALAERRRAGWVPEYGRAYTAQKWAGARAIAQLAGKPPPGMHELEWRTAEFVHIASEQLALENRAAREGGPLVVCDTDAFATAIWHERYIGAPSPEVHAIADGVPHALYLVTDHRDVPFEQDGLRDGESLRPWMTGRFLDALAASGRAHRLLSGTHQQRLAAAEAEVTRVLANAWTFR